MDEMSNPRQSKKERVLGVVAQPKKLKEILIGQHDESGPACGPK
jgi:hypothetical protein